MEQILKFLPDSPIVPFTILLLVILTLPPVFERLRLPGLVGLLFAGVVLGQNGLQLLDAESESMKLLSDIGKIYLMFVAGLETDLAEFSKKKDRSMGFGFATFAIPLIVGTLIGRIFGMGWNSSILIGSLLASHTLLAYPIVNRLGVLRNEAIIVTIGATIFTDIGALLVLAICLSIHSGEFSAASLTIQLLELAIYTVTVSFGLKWAGKEYFRRTGDEQSNQFLFVLLALFLASVGAQIINVDKIVGAFLAGLAVNEVVGHGPVEEKVVFVGSTLFIPCFFIDTGLLINLPVFIQTIQSDFALMLTIVGGLIGSKFLAAATAKLLYRYNWNEMLTMWSLSLPQVAATLAAALVAFQTENDMGERLIGESVFNSVIVLMLVTSILGPVLTARFAKKLPIPKTTIESEADDSQSPSTVEHHVFTVVVPVSNPHTQRHLIGVAAMIARHESGQIIPLSIANAHVHMDEPQLNKALRFSTRLVNRAVKISQKFDVEATPKIRIDDDPARGISRAAREENASLIVMGWGKTTGLRSFLFGNVIDSVFWSSHCPVAVMRLLDEPTNIQRILVPMKNITPQSMRTVKFAQIFADINQASVTLLHVAGRGTPLEQITFFEQELSQVVNQQKLHHVAEIKTIVDDAPGRVIIRAAEAIDLVILHSTRRRTAGGGLAVSDITTEVIKVLTCSMVLFGDPHS
ncbi:MAG: cation:proton antiporter [Gomphosphaeria aponina SAG 52.96 = DSM 107014]|uniref:Cation:proton antiporter n=1 Tax=Gomphosphaeria aponina SAG 52.96 = DSM 107014 TaxID=1521640 RepID=A0A941GV99_9CHRO|nr:cation:proton antiporter [Gomphosphaeria aponina SAG 52.96 = DSM 107014]